MSAHRASVPAQGGHGGHAKPAKQKNEIPTPEVWTVASYETDYRPTFRLPDTYIRAADFAYKLQSEFVEYDLDTEDEEWLESYNAGQARITAERCASALRDRPAACPAAAHTTLRHRGLRRFETMLWKLELACAAAQAQLAADRAAEAVERGGVASLATVVGHAEKVAQAANVDCLSKERALEALNSSLAKPHVMTCAPTPPPQLGAHWHTFSAPDAPRRAPLPQRCSSTGRRSASAWGSRCCGGCRCPPR